MAVHRIIVTRPREQAGCWVQALRDAGRVAVALPLMEIAAEPRNEQLDAARADLGRWAAVQFVSGNAVRHFFAGVAVERVARLASPPGGAGPRAWSPGPGTTEALLRAGWPPARIDAPPAFASRYDSESLWSVVAAQVRVATRVLIVRGGDASGRVAGRQWLARQVATAGGVAEQLVAYRRRMPDLGPEQRALLLEALEDGSLWIFSSSQAIGHLARLAPAADWSRVRALATHPRIAEAARAAGCQLVRTTHPRMDDILRVLEAGL